MQQQAFDLTQSTPRVNGGLMGRFVGQRVKLVGQVASVNGSSVTLKAADEATVTVILAGDPPTDQFLEVEGTVESPNTLKEESHTGFGSSFDLANYNEVCKLSCGDFAALFLDKQRS